MSSLWLPEQHPPQASAEAVGDILQRVQEEGVTATVADAWTHLEDDDSLVVDHLNRVSRDIEDWHSCGLLPERMMKIGASLAWLAYRETGYYQAVDSDSFGVNEMLAQLEGIPQAYFMSLCDDRELMRLLGLAEQAPDLPIAEVHKYREMTDIGAGCVRYYLQGAIAA